MTVHIMNQSHYPDLERCKKLTEIGFPKSDYAWCHMGDTRHKPGEKDVQIFTMGRETQRYREHSIAVCPSVMEMMDVNPDEITLLGRIHCFEIDVDYDGYHVGYNHNGSGKYFRGTLPNALADLIIWLVENCHLTFDKR